MALRLVIGNKNYSSWSLRPWIAMRNAGIPFDEVLIPLRTPEFKQRALQTSGTGKVPALVDGAVTVWETLAILEYLHEKFPAAGLWPADPAARAHARTLAAEMHAGFMPLRRSCPMNIWHPPKPVALDDEVLADVRRLDDMWTDCRRRFGVDGPFLFGAYGAVDAMYAPVVSRLQTYGIAMGAVARDYMDAALALPAWREWRSAALLEPWVMANNEPDWPAVPKLTS